MRTTPRCVLAILLAVAAGFAAHSASGNQYPPGAPPSSRPYPGDPYYGHGSPDLEVGFFYQELSPYGDWIYTYEYGWSWLPRDVRVGWRPYYYGQWVWSDYGWFWVSHEPFGWATYHFGRWAWYPRLGWIWVPGRTWGPAWVSWQHGGGWIGWAPLPPEVGFEIGIGLRFDGFDLRFGIRPDAYTFVEEQRLVDRQAYRHALPTARNVTIIRNTTNITNITIVGNRVVNRGVEVGRVERATGRSVRPLRVADSPGERNARVRGEEIRVYRPPKSRLDSVQVDERKLRRDRAATATSRSERRGGEPPARELEVAPRVRPEPPVTEQRREREEQKERQQLEAYERAERQRLEKLQREERARKSAATPATAREVEERHAKERQALEEQARREKQQLEARHEVARKAAKAQPAGKSKADSKKAEPKKPRSDAPPPR